MEELFEFIDYLWYDVIGQNSVEQLLVERKAMANGYKIIPSKSALHRHRQNNGKIPEWVLKRTHGSARDRKNGRSQLGFKANPEELPAPRATHTGLGPGQVFLCDPRGVRPVRSARR